jgi:hypothetical protein
MKSYDIIYKNNKFYDTATQKRIYPKDGQKFLLVGDDQNFGDHDPINIPPTAAELLDSAAKFIQVQKIKNLKTHRLFLKKGTQLYFEFNLTKRKSATEETHYRFWIELLEDLYLHTCNNWKTETPPELHACHCKVFKEETQNLEFFEPIYAKSLNEVVSKTRQFYFPNQGTPGASVYVTVKINSRETLEDLRQPLLQYF